ncbi:MAG: APC family permease [Halieaceae bacterium]|jgi:amino acid transporter|nr:APC family permease [Halieaceae bacterium]
MSERGALRLRRDIGSLGATLLVLNGLIGAGIFALPGKVAVNAGTASPWLFLCVGAIFLCVVLTFAALASYFEESGGPVLYARAAFGDGAGFATGWMLFVSRSSAFAANATVMATYLGAVVPGLDGAAGRAAVICVTTAVLTWANVRGVRSGVRAMLVLTLFKLTPLLLLVVLGFREVTGASFWPDLSSPIENLGSTTLLMVYAFVGFETVSVTAGETADPRRRLPRALLRTVVLISLFYFCVALVFVSVIPAEAYAEATLVDVGRRLAGPAGALVITLAAVFSIGGNLSSSMLAAPRILFALAELRMLPAALGRIHPRYRSPHIAILAMAALCLALALSGTFTALAIASTLSRLLSYLLCIGALPRVRAGASAELRREAFTLPGGLLIPALALSICLVLMAQTTLANWLAVGILLAVGVALYALARRAVSRVD